MSPAAGPKDAADRIWGGATAEPDAWAVAAGATASQTLIFHPRRSRG